jgi:hypothetical protein
MASQLNPSFADFLSFGTTIAIMWKENQDRFHCQFEKVPE